MSATLLQKEALESILWNEEHILPLHCFYIGFFLNNTNDETIKNTLAQNNLKDKEYPQYYHYYFDFRKYGEFIWDLKDYFYSAKSEKTEMVEQCGIIGMDYIIKELGYTNHLSSFVDHMAKLGYVYSGKHIFNVKSTLVLLQKYLQTHYEEDVETYSDILLNLML